MTSGQLNGRHDAGDAADRLSAAWDDIVERRPVEVTGGDDLIRLAQALSSRPTTVRERPGYRHELRDTIMHTATATYPTPGIPARSPADAPSNRPLALRTATAIRRTGSRWVGLAATIAFLLTTAAGGYLASVGLPGKDGPGPTMGVFAPKPPVAEATPKAGEFFACEDLEPYMPGCRPQPIVVASSAVAGEFSADDLTVTTTQMQRWQIEGGQAATFTAPVTPLKGIGMDVVINGAYVATFSAPTFIADNQSGIRGLYTYQPANAPVELVTGDVVTYELGTKVEIRNPLETSPLQFKTILFYEGDPSPDNLGASGSFGTTVDGDGTLPMSLSDFGPSGADITLTYSQILPNHPFPPDTSGLPYKLVLGPVDPVGGPVGTEGFVLWVVEGQG